MVRPLIGIVLITLSLILLHKGGETSLFSAHPESDGLSPLFSFLPPAPIDDIEVSSSALYLLNRKEKLLYTIPRRGGLADPNSLKVHHLDLVSPFLLGLDRGNILWILSEKGTLRPFAPSDHSPSAIELSLPFKPTSFAWLYEELLLTDGEKLYLYDLKRGVEEIEISLHSLPFFIRDLSTLYGEHEPYLLVATSSGQFLFSLERCPKEKLILHHHKTPSPIQGEGVSMPAHGETASLATGEIHGDTLILWTKNFSEITSFRRPFEEQFALSLETNTTEKGEEPRLRWSPILEAAAYAVGIGTTEKLISTKWTSRQELPLPLDLLTGERRFSIWVAALSRRGEVLSHSRNTELLIRPGLTAILMPSTCGAQR